MVLRPRLETLSPEKSPAQADEFRSDETTTDENRRGLPRSFWQWMVSLLMHAVLLGTLALIVIPAGVGSLSLDFLAEMAEGDPLLTSNVDVTLATDLDPANDQLLDESLVFNEAPDFTDPSEPLRPDAMVPLDPGLVKSDEEKLLNESAKSDSSDMLSNPPTTEPRSSNPVGKKKANATRVASSVDGVIQKIGQDIAASLESNRTLVVWLFDQSPSLITQRAEILKQLTDIYSETGGLSIDQKVSFADHSQKALLTQVSAFGQGYDQALTKPVSTFKPVARSIKSIVRDDSGVENVMNSVLETVSSYRGLSRIDKNKGSRKCNVIIVVITDEAGDDIDLVEDAITACQRALIPVYVIGVPSPFGEQKSNVDWTDPDVPDSPTVPAFVNQGPESFVFERVAASCRRGILPDQDELAKLLKLRKLLPPPVDSGFGPYALTRLCRETGGIYFAVHKNRDDSATGWEGVATFTSHLTQFYSPDVMKDYQPNYLSANDYSQMLKENPLRKAVVNASGVSTSGELILRTECRFFKSSFPRKLADEKRTATAYAKRLERVYRDLKAVEGEYEYEDSPRWRANYQLALATVEGALARLYSWTALLEFLGNRRPSFDKANVSQTNNIMDIHESIELLDDERIHSMVNHVKKRCRKIIYDHPGTPWATLADWEMNIPYGFRKTERYVRPGKRPTLPSSTGGPTLQRL